MSKDCFKVPHNKNMGKKPKDWEVPKYGKENILKALLNGRQENVLCKLSDIEHCKYLEETI